MHAYIQIHTQTFVIILMLVHDFVRHKALNYHKMCYDV